jgi:hypothetical protein
VRRWGHLFAQLSVEEFAEEQAAFAKAWALTQGDGAALPCFAVPLDGSPPYMAVRPVRVRCEFYKRQVYANDDVADKGDFGHSIVFRNCTMRKSVGGAFLSLSNQAIYACDYRSPAHPESVQKHLDEKDKRRLAMVVEEVPLFNLQTAPLSPVDASAHADPPPATVYRTGDK